VNQPRERQKLNGKTALLMIGLITAGFAGNFFALPLFTGFSYLFGSIATILAVRLFGIRWGLLVALISSSWTIELFGHPYAMVWLCLEPLFVGYLLRRGSSRNIILYDALYWPLLGAPLIWFIFLYVMHVPLLGTVAAILMYWVIGISNALAASLLLSFFPRFSDTAGAGTPHTVPIQTMIFNLMMATVAVPAVIIMVIYGRNLDQRHMHDLFDWLQDSSRIAVYETRFWLQQRPDGQQLPEYLKARRADISQRLKTMRIKQHHAITVLDEQGSVVVSTNEQIPVGSIFDPCPDGIVTPTSQESIKRCMPQPSTPLPLWQRALKSSYSITTPLENSPPWSIVVEVPYLHYQRLMLKEHINSLLVVLTLNFMALITSMMASLRLAAPLRRISQLTTDLPERLTREKIETWPTSMITELDQLIQNSQAMSKALTQRFREISYANETLELHVEERSRELTRANAELQREISGHQATERQLDHMMHELINQLRLLQTLIDAIPNPIFYKDANGLYQGCNRALEECWGLSREEIIGKTPGDIFPAAVAEVFNKADEELFNKPGAQIYEAQMRYADGLNHAVIFYKATFNDTKSNLAGLVGTIIDITPRKQAETERDRLMLELQRKNKELESIVYVASHDLRSPLINVQGFSRKLAKNCQEIERIIDGLDPGEREQEQLRAIVHDSIPKALGFITNSIEKMDTLLSGLLRLSRLGRAALCYETLDIQAIMSKIEASLTYQIEAAGARIEHGFLAPCVADAVQINQVFSNLLDNAIKYRSPDRPLLVRIFSEPCPEGVRYIFEDNGIGIHPDHLESIWEIFHRISADGTSGEGLGLTMARRIVDRLAGSITVQSEPGVGSRFIVTLPAAAVTP